MQSPFALFTILVLLLIASTTNARSHPAEYWQTVMKDEAMPKAIQGLIDAVDSVSSLANKKMEDCHTSTSSTAGNKNEHELVEDNAQKKPYAEEFEPRPNISAYDDDKKLKEDETFDKDFEPRPNLSAYDDDKKLKEDESFVKDFEPRPNISAYDDDKKLKEDESFVKDFEPRPNISAYDDDKKLKEGKSFVKDFEPRPNISAYEDGNKLKKDELW